MTEREAMEILGIEGVLTEESLKAAFRIEGKATHPDGKPKEQCEEFTEKFKKVNEANTLLKKWLDNPYNKEKELVGTGKKKVDNTSKANQNTSSGTGGFDDSPFDFWSKSKHERRTPPPPPRQPPPPPRYPVHEGIYATQRRKDVAGGRFAVKVNKNRTIIVEDIESGKQWTCNAVWLDEFGKLNWSKLDGTQGQTVAPTIKSKYVPRRDTEAREGLYELWTAPNRTRIFSLEAEVDDRGTKSFILKDDEIELKLVWAKEDNLGRLHYRPRFRDVEIADIAQYSKFPEAKLGTYFTEHGTYRLTKSHNSEKLVLSKKRRDGSFAFEGVGHAAEIRDIYLHLFNKERGYAYKIGPIEDFDISLRGFMRSLKKSFTQPEGDDEQPRR